MSDAYYDRSSHRGDDGTTLLSDGTRVEKDSPYVECVGAVDELNSLLGMVIAAGCDPDVRSVLADTQEELLALSAELARPGSVMLMPKALQRVERELGKWGGQLSKPDGTVVPRGVMAAALCFKARATCRTLERELVSLAARDPDGSIGSTRLPYTNRLSDLLAALAGVINRRAGVEVIPAAPPARAG